MRLVGVLGLLLCMSVIALACGGTPPDGGASETGGPGAPSEPGQLVLDDATMVLEVDFQAVLDASELPILGLTAILDEYEGAEDTRDLQDMFEDQWDEAGPSLGTDVADVEALLSIAIQRTGYFVVKGGFDFGEIERELEARDFEEDTYRDHRIWEHDRGESVALFPGSGMYIYGDDDVVKDVLRAISRGEGLMEDEAGLRRALGAAGDGLVRLAMGCDAIGMHSPGSLSSLVGRLDESCEGVAVVVSGGDEDETGAVIAYVYGSERRAESAKEELEGLIEDSDEIDADVEDIEVDGDTVTLRLMVYGGSPGRALTAPAPAPTLAPAPTVRPAPIAQPAPTAAPAAPPAPTASPTPTTQAQQPASTVSPTPTPQATQPAPTAVPAPTLAPTRAPAPLVTRRSFRIGVMESVTGPGETYGTVAVQAKQMAVDEINEAGGVNGRMIELVVEDSKCSARDAITAYNKLTDVEGVKIILGTSCSGALLGVAPLAEEDGVVLFSGLASNPAIAEAGDYIFRTAMSDAQVGIDTGNVLWADGVRKLATINEQTDYADYVRRDSVAQFEKLGGEVVSEERYSSDTTDFRGYLTRLINASPDALHVAAQSEYAGGTIAKQARELGFEGPIYSNVVAVGSTALGIAGDAATGVKAAIAELDPANHKAQEVLKNFRERYGYVRLPWYLGSAYDTAFISAECLKKTGDDQNADGFRDCLYDITWSGAIGDAYRFDDRGEVVGVSNVVVEVLPLAERTEENQGYKKLGSASLVTKSQRVGQLGIAITPTPAPVEPTGRTKLYDTFPAMTIDPDKSYTATFELENGGKFTVELYAKEAPKTVNSFVFLSREGFYDGVTFHRVIKDFMAQGGDPTGTGTGGPGYSFENEVSPIRRHDVPGTLSMANAGGTATNGSQFFITFVPTPFLDGYEADGTPKDCAQRGVSCHTVFGRVIQGMDVVNSISLRDPSTARTPGDAIKTIAIAEKAGNNGSGERPTTSAPTAAPTQAVTAGQQPAATKAYDSTENMFRLFIGRDHSPDETLDALSLAVANNDKSMVPLMIELLRFFSDQDLVVETRDAISAITGREFRREQGAWNEWMEWLGKNAEEYSPPDGYVLWKSNLMSLIDPRFADFLAPAEQGSRINLFEVAWGGVRPDGIPDLQNAPVVAAGEQEYLQPSDRVFGVSINGEHRAYPLRIVNAHEMANDVLGGEPISLAY